MADINYGKPVDGRKPVLAFWHDLAGEERLYLACLGQVKRWSRWVDLYEVLEGDFAHRLCPVDGDMMRHTRDAFPFIRCYRCGFEDEVLVYLWTGGRTEEGASSS